MVGDDGRVCRHAHCAGKDPQTGSVAPECQVLCGSTIASTSTIHKALEESADGGKFFRPMDYLSSFIRSISLYSH